MKPNYTAQTKSDRYTHRFVNLPRLLLLVVVVAAAAVVVVVVLLLLLLLVTISSIMSRGTGPEADGSHGHKVHMLGGQRQRPQPRV